jgi:hypothetical protein
MKCSRLLNKFILKLITIFSEICHQYNMQPPSSPVDKTALFLSIKQLGHEHDHSAQSNAKIKNVQSFNFTPSSTSTTG